MRTHRSLGGVRCVRAALDAPYDSGQLTRSAEDLRTPLDVWLYFLRHAEHLDTDALPAALDEVPEVHRAMGELQMMTQSELERERYEARLKMQRDLYTNLAVARDEGLQEGLTKGIREGLTKGLQEGQVKRVHFCQRLLRRDLMPADQLRTMPPDELERLAQQLEAELVQALGQNS